jgi:hypothetical protein
MLPPFRLTASLWTASLLWVSALVPGCASRRTSKPPVQTLTLGDRQVPYRDYRGYDLCAQDPVLLAAELDGSNLLLADFLQSTSAGTDGVWADEHLALLSGGQANLPSALSPLGETYRNLRRCRLDADTGLPEIIRRGEELVRQSTARLNDAPELLALGAARREIALWEASLPSLRERSRKEHCKRGKHDARKPVIFFATENSEGGKLWLFCDGYWMRGTSQGSAEVIPPKRRPAPKRLADPRPYLEAAARHPSSQTVRSPRLLQKQSATKPPSDDFRLDDESGIDP